jgi:hypothetical protein
MAKAKGKCAKAKAATKSAKDAKVPRAKAKAKSAAIPNRASLMPDPSDTLHPLQLVAAADDEARRKRDASPVQEHDDLHDPMTPTSSSKRRRSNRRDVEGQAVRLARKFLVPKFGQAIMGKVNKQGEKILAVIQDKLVELQISNKYWTNQHWMDVYEAFELAVPIANKLAKPPESDEPPRDELLEKLGMIHAKNPAERSAEPLEMYLMHLETDLTQREMFGVLVACGESPIVARSCHFRCYMAIASYMGRWIYIIYILKTNA